MSAGSQLLRPPRSHRPRAMTLTVKDLVAQVRSGEIRIPSQRPLRWKAPDVQALFDSIWRGLPVGTLTFWEQPAPAGEEVIGGATILVPSEISAWWVVDGQQRIASLAAVLLDLDHHDDHRWQLFFDPDEPGFVPWSSSVSEHAVPVSVLGDLQRLLRWTRDHDPNTARIARIEDARQQLLDYAIPAYVDDDIEVVRAACVRINSAGRPLPIDEVIGGILATPHLGEGELDLDALQALCDRNDFGMPSRADVIDAVLAMRVDAMDTDGELERRRDDSTFFGDQDAAADALARTVVFLQEGCGIPHVRLIPHFGVLPVLARWFHVHGRSEPATMHRLAQWVWRESMVAHRREANPPWSEHARAIRAGDEQESLDRLMTLVGPRPLATWSLERFNPRSVRSRIEMLALLAAEPRDRSGFVRLGALLSDDQIAREIVSPRVDDELDPRLVRSIANRALLDTRLMWLADELRAWTVEEDEAALRSQLIGPEAFAALKAQDFGTFLRLRAVALEEHVAGWLEGRTQWNGPVVRPHRYYSDEMLERTSNDEATK